MTGIHRERPGAADLSSATGAPAVALGADIWMSPGVSNAYAIGTDAGRVIVNTGLAFEGPLHRKAFDGVIPGRTATIVVSQGHPDHWGGIGSFRDSDTEIVMQSNYHYWRDDMARLSIFRAGHTGFAFAKFGQALMEHLKSVDLSSVDMSFTEPTSTFDKSRHLTVGGRDLELLWTPGGETTDALAVWVPDDRVVFTGNLFGPLFGHVPNLVTIRGDRYRDPILYIEAADAILALHPEKLVTGHFEPIEGADRIAEEVTAMRDAMQWVHDRTVEGMEGGKDVYTLMRDVKVPEHLDVGEGYGRTAWNVRAIWEMYAGWFYHRSTTELYPVAPTAVFADLVSAAGAEKLVEAARARLAAGQPVEALQLTDIVLGVDGTSIQARAIAADAHQRLLDTAENFWERAWLNRAVNELRETS